MQRSSPLARLSARVHQSRQRHGLAGVAQRLALVILPAPTAAVPAQPVLLALERATPEQNLARERARRALIEARQTMSGVIGEEMVVAGRTDEPTPPAITPDWDQLQAYLEESDRERTRLKEELADLRETVRALQSRLDDFERTLPASTATPLNPDADEAAPAIDAVADQPETTGATEGTEAKTATEEAAETATPPQELALSATLPATDEPSEDAAQVQELRERVLRALRERVFAAGTVGTRVFVSPAPAEAALRGMIERFNEDPLVEHAEPVEVKEEEDAAAVLIRVTLRAPMRWEQFGALLERALDLPAGQVDVRWSQGAVRMRLSSAPPSSGSESDLDAAEPCV